MKKVIYESVANQKEAAKRPDVTRYEDHAAIPENLKTFAKGRRFFIRTYGCQANVRDEEVMAGYLTEAGFTRTFDPNEADLAIINTCAVRENAEDKIYGEIGSFKANYERDHSFLLVLAGCVMGENGVAESFLKSYPWVALVIGTHDVSRLNPLLGEVLAKKATIVNVRSFSSEVVENLPSVRLNAYEAFVNISYGCDKFCTYCIVPYTRGRERSRRLEDVLKECQDLVNHGYKQITLLGQNVNSYGLDFKDGTTFAELLEKVAQTGIPHLRFLTSYPSQFTDAMLDVMSRYSNIDPWLHFPVQSGSTSCLKRMGRRYTREEYLALVHKIRKAVPNIALTTDLIVGFPGETEEEFQDTLSLCEEVRYSSAYTFIYSPRPGTPAAKMEQVPPEVSHERFNRLKKLIDDLTTESSNECIGKTYTVLVQGPSKKDSNILTSYAPNGKLIHFEGPAYLTGAFAPVKVTSSHVYSLHGELLEDPLIVKAKDVAFTLHADPVVREYLKLDEEVRNNPEIHALGEALVNAKKALALAQGDDQKYPAAKAQYEAVVKQIHEHPLLTNRDALRDAVEDTLKELQEDLR